MFQFKKLRHTIAFLLVSVITSTSFAAFRCEDVIEDFETIWELFYSRDKGSRSGGNSGGAPPPGSAGGRSGGNSGGSPPPPGGAGGGLGGGRNGGSSSGGSGSVGGTASDSMTTAELSARDLKFAFQSLDTTGTSLADLSRLLRSKDSGLKFDYKDAATFTTIFKKPPTEFTSPTFKIDFVNEFKFLRPENLPRLFRLFESVEGGVAKRVRLSFKDGQFRIVALEKSQLAHFGLENLQIGKMGLTADSPILLIGEGLTGDIFQALKDRGFRNVRSIDKAYGEKSLDALSQAPETAAAVQTLRRLMQQHPNDIVAGDATNLQNSERSGSQHLILAHNLFEGMDRNSVHKILNEAVRLLGPGRLSRFTLPDGDSRTAATMWAVKNRNALEQSGYRIEVVGPPKSSTSYLDIVAPRSTENTGDGKQPPATAAAVLREVAPAFEALVNPTVAKAAEKGMEVTVFMRDRKLSQQDQVDLFNRFLEIYLPQLVGKSNTATYKVALSFFQEQVLAPYKLGQLAKIEETLQRLFDARRIVSLSVDTYRGAPEVFYLNVYSPYLGAGNIRDHQLSPGPIFKESTRRGDRNWLTIYNNLLKD